MNKAVHYLTHHCTNLSYSLYAQLMTWIVIIIVTDTKTDNISTYNWRPKR